MKSLVKILIKKRLKISFAESCTGGLLASSITSIIGASKVFNLGLITYSNQTKIKVLKINKDIIRKYGAVSHECCLAMVNNLSKISKANINVSITGIAGPNGGTKQKPVGLVYIGIKRGNKTLINKFIKRGNKTLINKFFFKKKTRSSVQKATVKKAFELVIRITK